MWVLFHLNKFTWGAPYTFDLQITRMWELRIRVGELNIDLLGHVHIFGQIIIINTNIMLKDAFDIQGCQCSLQTNICAD